MSLVPLALASLAFGFSSSLHCAAMCGPIVGAVVPTRVGPASAYVISRIAAYALAGLLFGAFGELLVSALPAMTVPAVALVGAVFLGAQALGVSVPGPRIRGLKLPGAWVASKLMGASGWRRGVLLGVVTAIMPCGLLASVYALSAATGRAISGSLSAGLFAVGSTVGLLVIPAALRLVVPARLATWVQRGAVLVAAVVLFSRAVMQMRTGSCCP